MSQHPEIAVSAALFREDEVLLIERSQNQTLPGLISLPGGRVGFGETLRVAISREVLEEVGLTIDPDRFAFVTNHEAVYDEFHFVICVHTAEIRRDAEPIAGSDAAAVRFVAFESVRELEANNRTTPGLAAAVERARALLR